MTCTLDRSWGYAVLDTQTSQPLSYFAERRARVLNQERRRQQQRVRHLRSDLSNDEEEEEEEERECERTAEQGQDRLEEKTEVPAGDIDKDGGEVEQQNSTRLTKSGAVDEAKRLQRREKAPPDELAEGGYKAFPPMEASEGSAYTSARHHKDNTHRRRHADRRHRSRRRPADPRSGSKVSESVCKDKQVPLPKKDPLEPELSTLKRETASKVAGSDKWLRTRAPLNQPLAKPPVPKKEGTIYRLHDREERPVGVVCCLCGKECGLASIHWHFQKCLIKWDRRRGLPRVMDLFDPRGIPKEPGPDLEKYNEQARAVYANEVLPKCPKCSKSFLPSSIVAHMKDCCKLKPKLIEEYEKTFNPDGYHALAEVLIGGKANNRVAEKKQKQATLRIPEAHPLPTRKIAWSDDYRVPGKVTRLGMAERRKRAAALNNEQDGPRLNRS